MTAALLAFVHHLAAFAIVTALAIELVLLRGELTLQRARQLRKVDAVYGIAAGLVLVIGFLRATMFEKGWDFYLHSPAFHAKLTLFVIVGLLSIYPTIEFLSWRKAVNAGQVPAISPARQQTLRRLVHFELAGLALILLAAALMAKGVGYSA